MKILVTGFTGKQAEVSPTFRFAQQSVTVEALLRELGHEVDLRPVTVGEDLSAYSSVLVYLFIPGHYASVHQAGALWALGSRPDALWVLDDWNVKPIAVEARKLLPKSKNIDDKSRRALSELGGDGAWARRCLFPLFKKNANPQGINFVAVREAVVVDFTEYWLGRYSEAAAGLPAVTRERRWIHTALSRDDDWRASCKFEWPLLTFGDKMIPGNRRHEADLIPDIASSWGILSAPHPNPGSGWWRVRFALGAACGTPVFGDPHELRKVYGTDELWRGVKRFEGQTDSELTALAEAQSVALVREMMSHEEVLEKLAHFIN